MAFDPIYNIIDKHFICTLQLIAPLNQGEQNWHPGTVLNARLNFEDSLQLCNKVQVRLIQCENHPNGSHIQEKIMGQCTRSTVDALLVCLSVTIPSESPCEFVSPVFTVSLFAIILTVRIVCVNRFLVNVGNLQSGGRFSFSWQSRRPSDVVDAYQHSIVFRFVHENEKLCTRNCRLSIPIDGIFSRAGLLMCTYILWNHFQIPLQGIDLIILVGSYPICMYNTRMLPIKSIVFIVLFPWSYYNIYTWTRLRS